MPHKIIVAAGVLQRADGQFLLAQRPPGKAYAGYWEFPGGKVEAGESTLATLQRELYEELGIHATEVYPWLRREFVYPHATVSLHFFRVRAWQGELSGREGQAFAWQTMTPDVSPILPANTPILAALGLPEQYAITGFEPQQQAQALVRIEFALDQGLRLVQIRGKDWQQAAFSQFAAEVVSLAHRYGARAIVNGNYALAADICADGVHLTAKELRALTTRPALPLVAASCHDAFELAQAEALGLDFVVLGPVLPTQSHPGAPHLGWSRFGDLCANRSVPIYALGGLVRADLPLALVQGAHGIAMIRGAWVA
jgi:8-oxo-dGTP diphosphatase